MAVLALFTCLQRDRQPFEKNLLLNARRVVSFTKDSQSPLSKTQLWYNEGDGERGKTVSYQLSHFINTVSTRLFEDETNPFIYVQVVSYKEIGFSKERVPMANQDKWKINSDAVLYAYDISTTQSYIFLQKGLNVLRLLTSHTVADLSRAYSRSNSLSKS